MDDNNKVPIQPNPEAFKRAQDAVKLMMNPPPKSPLVLKIEFVEEDMERTAELLRDSDTDEDREHLRILRGLFLEAIGQLK